MANRLAPLAPEIFPGGLFLLFLLLPLFLILIPNAEAAEQDKEANKALVLFTFGTTYSQKSDPLALIRAEIASRHPNLATRVAYSSAHVVKTLKSKGEDARTLPQVLADLSADGYTRIAVQSLHVIPGLEFDIARDIAGRDDRLPKGIERIALGRPLIGSHEDAEAVARVLAGTLPAERKAGDAVVLVGHGAASPSGSLAYPALQSFLSRLDSKIFVGTIEGPFTLEATLAALKASGAKKVWLFPLLLVVGDHATNDIFGDEADSWRQTFSKAGIQAVPVSRGLAAVPALVSLWADHAEGALAELDAAP
jgi:sirohydrochlorin cobaltochelatase